MDEEVANGKHTDVNQTRTAVLVLCKGEKENMNEGKYYTVAVGNAPAPWARRKVKRMAKEAFQYISKLDGFVGFHPMPPKGTLCIFRTENDAKIARNMMDVKGIQTGYNICEIFIEEKYVKGKNNETD